METYSKMHVKEGTVLKLLCPDDKCQGAIPPNLLKKLLGDADFERWERLILKRTLDSMVDVTYCPRCETACLEDDDNNAQCSKCCFSFCTRCRERRHIGLHLCLSCPFAQEVWSRVLTWENFSLPQQADLNSISSIREWWEKTETLLPKDRRRAFNGVVIYTTWNLWKERNRRIFEHCSLSPLQIGNNNHMICWACQVHYCALCRKVVRKSSEHYGTRGCKQHTVDPKIPKVLKTVT
ncbi:hypothetical protein U9M48_033633 [Paspalum notatum var. saurae]|uniref:RBR-type E3 ubiquitin transferase n=1 Tax=Paspalum notatum var. saurae TaxID=547442 RepID=A0AAQ3X6R7_PASNO